MPRKDERHRLSARTAIQRRLSLLVVAIAAVWGSAPVQGQTTKTLTRNLEPVTKTADEVKLNFFYNIPISNLAAYSYNASTQVWKQIPFQVDQRAYKDLGDLVQCVNGQPPCACQTPNTCDLCEVSYVWDTPAENDPDDVSVQNSLDSNDEIVFMAKDTGDQAPSNIWLPGMSERYEVEVFTPTDGAGWVYLYKFPAPAPSLAPYVRLVDNCTDPAPPLPPNPCRTSQATFEGCNHEGLRGYDIYQAVLTGNWKLIDLKVKAVPTQGGPSCDVTYDTVDVLDRYKWRVPGENEELWNGSSKRLGYRNGPVRGIRGSVGAQSGWGTTHYFSAFPTWWREDVHLRVHPLPGSLLGYIDWMKAAANLPTSYSCPVQNFDVWRTGLQTPPAPLLDYVDGCFSGSLNNVSVYEARQLNGPHISLAEVLLEDSQHTIPPWCPDPPPPGGCTGSKKLMYYKEDGNAPLEPEDEAGAYGNIGVEFVNTNSTKEKDCTEVNFAGFTRIWQVKVSDSGKGRASMLDEDVRDDPLRVTSNYQCIGCGGGPIPPCPPTINAVNPGTGFNTNLSVASSCGTDGLWFQVFKAGATGPFQLLENLGANLTIKDYRVQRNQTYRYYAVSYNATGQTSSPSPTVTLTVTDTTPPGPPVLSGSISGSTVTLTWNWTSEFDLHGYNIYRSLISGGPYSKINIGPPIRDTSHTSIVTGSQVTYYFVVKTVDQGGQESVASNQVALTTP